MVATGSQSSSNLCSQSLERVDTYLFILCLLFAYGQNLQRLCFYTGSYYRLVAHTVAELWQHMTTNSAILSESQKFSNFKAGCMLIAPCIQDRSYRHPIIYSLEPQANVPCLTHSCFQSDSHIITKCSESDSFSPKGLILSRTFAFHALLTVTKIHPQNVWPPCHFCDCAPSHFCIINSETILMVLPSWCWHDSTTVQATSLINNRDLKWDNFQLQFC